MCDIIETISSYLLLGNIIQYPRFQSWEKCYSYFRRKFETNVRVINDVDCLQLGFYLASWGMYRGKSFLLQHSYEIHKSVLDEIFQLKYNLLWDINYDDVIDNGSLDLLISLYSSIIDKYQVETTPQQKVSDTLVTKIIMGTMGITPAYDRFFKDGCRSIDGRPYLSFNRESFNRIIQFYQDNIGSFHQANANIPQNAAIHYPAMKLVDMYFWSIGFNKEFNQVE